MATQHMSCEYRNFRGPPRVSQMPSSGWSQWSEDEGIWASPFCMPTGDPAVQRLEFSVGDATLEFTPAAVAEIFAGLIGR
jgi:hypothetical protein